MFLLASPWNGPALGRKRAFLALRQERLGDRLGARQRYEAVSELLGKEENVSTDVKLRAWQLYSAVKLKQMQDSLADKPQDKDARQKLVRKLVEEANDRYKKREGSARIGQHLALDNTRSPSFRHWVAGIRRLGAALLNA